ncbi:MAG: SGNH/GDSL hydrolase family protein [Pseudomonadota bacterium]
MLKFLKDSWLIAGITLLLLLVVDAALKSLLEETQLPLVLPGATAPNRASSPALGDAPWASAYFRELRQARRTEWSAWEYWRRKPFSGEYINIDESGLRRSWSPDAPTHNIWMAGGSTVWGTGARDDHTLPSALARSLAQRGLNARVLNLGESGYVSGQSQLRVLRRLESEPAPDLVVFYDGVNDVYAALQAGQAGLSQNEAHRRADFRVTDGLDNYLQAAPRVLEGIQRLLARNAEPAMPAVAPLAAEVAQRYAFRVELTAAAAAAAGVKTTFIWQPSVFSKAAKAPVEVQIENASLARHRDLQLASDQAVAQQLSGTDFFFDMTGSLDDHPEALLLDFCHLSEAGNRVIADLLAPQVLTLLAKD